MKLFVSKTPVTSIPICEYGAYWHWVYALPHAVVYICLTHTLIHTSTTMYNIISNPLHHTLLQTFICPSRGLWATYMRAQSRWQSSWLPQIMTSDTITRDWETFPFPVSAVVGSTSSCPGVVWGEQCRSYSMSLSSWSFENSYEYATVEWFSYKIKGKDLHTGFGSKRKKTQRT